MVPLNARKARQRRAARAVQHPQERALGGERIAGVGVKDRRERGQRRRIEPDAEEQNEADERGHHEPRAAPVQGLVLVEVQKAFVSFVRAYKEHQCNFIFVLSQLAFGDVARGFGLLYVCISLSLE